jgi:Hemerythrin HHE cation binding domain
MARTKKKAFKHVTRSPRRATQSPSGARLSSKRAPRKMARLIKELTREDLKLGAPLLDAAVAGVCLGFRPHDGEMRAQAAHTWDSIKPLLSHHLLSEDETLLPWAQDTPGFPHELVERIRKQHTELRALTKTINSTSFRTGPDPQVSRAGKALCALAVKLDDFISCEEFRILPALRRFVFAEGEPASEVVSEPSGC